MKDKRMKTSVTSVNTGEVSSPPAQVDGRGVKMRAGHRDGSEKQVFGNAKWLARPNDGRIIAKRTGETQFAP
jgi:hypothetical protein